MKKVDLSFFPGWTRKSVSFTIDDGNVPLDTKFINIVKPYGIRGTFNICAGRMTYMDAEGYREFYKGYEIANHANTHPFCFPDAVEYSFTDMPFDKETADETLVYKSEEEDTFWVKKPRYWARYKTPDAYIEDVKLGQAGLEAVFGKGNVRSYVWPYGEQKSEKVHAALKQMGYYGIRKTGATEDTYGFDIPSDRMAWSYNATHLTLNDVMAKFEAYEDDGKLKAFIFGVHSHDFERSDNWCDLEAFAVKYGNRPDEFFYATVGEIFDYEDAIKAATVTEDGITNNSSLTLYITVDGERKTVAPNSTIAI